MVKLSELVAAAEQADPERLEQALVVLRGQDAGRVEVKTAEACERLGVSRRTILRHGRPVRRFAGQNIYDLEELRECLTKKPGFDI